MYVCEFPGCSYQSDRNFNFLRHKRTHGKPKNDENKKLQNGTPTPSELIYGNSNVKSPNLNDSSFIGLEFGSINNDLINLSSQMPIIPNELNLNLAQCNSVNLSENDQPFSLTNEEFLQQQNMIMKDINNFDQALSDNQFSSLTLDQAFLP